jgi:hypothetical protein
MGCGWSVDADFVLCSLGSLAVDLVLDGGSLHAYICTCMSVVSSWVMPRYLHCSPNRRNTREINHDPGTGACRRDG